MTDDREKIIIGVDTHKDFHQVAAITLLGEALGDEKFPATTAGYVRLLTWIFGLGEVVRAGVEGTGSYGLALTRRLTSAGVTVIDVIAPDRQERRLRGKTDQADAYAAARAVLSRRAITTPKNHDGQVEAVRVLSTTRRLIVKQRTQAMNQLKSFLVTAPEQLREKLTSPSGQKLAGACARLRHSARDDVLVDAAKTSLRMLGNRIMDLAAQDKDLARQIRALVKSYAPELLDVYGAGPDVAANLLVAAGQNSDRLTGEGALAHLTGVAPLPASSGKTVRYRLSRGGNRQANAAVYRIAFVRMGRDKRTKDYIARTIERGKTKKEAIRLLKRYIVREIYQVLKTINTRHAVETTTPNHAPETSVNAA